MKINTLHSVINLLETSVISSAIILLGAIATAEAQDSIPNLEDFNFNGLFTPTSTQRFFEAGRKDFEEEIDFLTNPDRYFNGELLQIDLELIEQNEENKPFPDLRQDDSQNE